MSVKALAQVGISIIFTCHTLKFLP